MNPQACLVVLDFGALDQWCQVLFLPEAWWCFVMLFQRVYPLSCPYQPKGCGSIAAAALYKLERNTNKKGHIMLWWVRHKAWVSRRAYHSSKKPASCGLNLTYKKWNLAEDLCQLILVPSNQKISKTIPSDSNMARLPFMNKAMSKRKCPLTLLRSCYLVLRITCIPSSSINVVLDSEICECYLHLVHGF